MDLASVKNRIDLYKKQTVPVLEYLEWLGLVRHINANQPIDVVFADVIKVVSEE
jgi:adenylate kinase family enzyme